MLVDPWRQEQCLGQGPECIEQGSQDRVGGFGGLACGQQEARVPFMGDEDGLAVSCEKHEVGFPMAGLAAVVCLGRSVVDGAPMLDVLNG